MKSTMIRSIFTLCFSGMTSLTFAQSQLEVKCYNYAAIENGFYVNGQMVEYAMCNPDPDFYVAVLDPTNCSSWGTNFNGANPDHSFGNLNDGAQTPCRQRVEHYFVFEKDDSLQLAGMLNMLQQVPIGHSIIIYTPVSYDFASVSAVNSNLTDELSSRWNPSVIQGNSMMILYGEQGNPMSYVEATTVVDDHITLTHTVCNNLGIQEENAMDKLILKTEGNTLYLNPDLAIDGIVITDAMGRQVPFVKNDLSLTLNPSVNSGMYVFQFVSGKKTYRAKLMMTF